MAERKETESGEIELDNMSKIRKIAFSNLNHSVEVISTYQDDDLEILSNLALNIFRLIKEIEEEDN